MSRRCMSLIALLCLGVLVAACGEQTGAERNGASGDTSGTGPGAQVGDGLTVVATVFGLAWIADQIAPGADVTFLGAPGQDPHDLELSPGDREVIETADVLLYVGQLDFQPQVESAAPSARGVVVDIAEIAGHQRLRDDDDDHDDGGDDDHDDEASDPHLWFDALIMADVAEATGAAFASADGDNAADYEANAASVAAQLHDVDADIDALLDDCRLDTAIVSHEAYTYLLAPRGLRHEGISGTGGHGDASPQRLAELTERIRDEDISAVAAEPIEGRADAEALAAEAGVDIIEIDPLEVVTDEQFEVGYPDLLREQAVAFATVLECGSA